MEALGSSKYDGPSAQAPSAGSLTPRNDPVCFSDLIAETFLQQAGGAIGLPSDSITHHPYTGAETVPQADWLTPMRVETPPFRPGDRNHLSFIPGAGHARPRPSRWQALRAAPHGHIKDLARLLVEEE